MAPGFKKLVAKGKKRRSTGKSSAITVTAPEVSSSEISSISDTGITSPGTSGGAITQGSKKAARKGSQNSGKTPSKKKIKAQKGGMTNGSSDEKRRQLGKIGIQKPRKAPARKRQAKKDDSSDDESDKETTPLPRTRNENPHVRGGLPYNTKQEPLAPNFSLTDHQRKHRRLALRNRIATHPVTSEEVDEHLNATGWDVDFAYHRWCARHMQAITAVSCGELIRPSFNTRAPPRDCGSEGEEDGEESQESEDFIPYPHDADPERERRRLVIFLWELVQKARPAVGSPPLRRSEAIILLKETDWDVIQARNLYLEHQLVLDAFTNSYRHFRGPTQLRSERDDRLARLIDLTGRRDIDSLQAHLRRHNYNFIAAVVAWQKSGIPIIPYEDRPDVEDQDPISDHISWCDERPSDVEEEREGGNEDGQENDVVKYGFLINPDRRGALKGVCDHTKMFIECIHNGKYKARTFQHKGYRWSNEHPQDRPEFDFESQDDIHKLNNWRREILRRNTGNMTNRPQGTTWLEVEDDFLYDLHREVWDELIAEHPDENPQNFLPLPVPSSRRREWARRFNEEFEGTLQEGSDGVRPHRSYGAINTHRHRVQRIIADFGLERNDPHPKDKGDEANDKGETTKIPPKKGNKPPKKIEKFPKSQKITKRNQDEVDGHSDDDGKQEPRIESEDGA